MYSSFTDASQHEFEKKFKRQRWDNLDKYFFLNCSCFSLFRNVLKKAYDQITKNGHALDVDTFVKLMLEYKPLMRKLHKDRYK